MRVRLGVVFVLLALTPGAARAQVYESVGIRAQGMGGAFVAVADDATATWWNPAGLASGPLFDALLEYSRVRATPQTSVRGVAVAFPSLGLSYYRLPLNNAIDQHLSVYGVTFGQSVSQHLVIASTLKLEQAGETHGDLDVGALVRIGVAQVGLSVKNVREARFETASGTLALDRQARAGFALLGRSDGAIKEMNIAADVDLIRIRSLSGEEIRHLAGGMELWVLNKRLGLRGGASRNTVGEQGSSASGGVSVALRSGLYVDAHHSNGTDRSRKTWGFALRSTF